MDIGDIVFYTGDLKHAFDDATLDIMKKYLKIDDLYIIKDIKNYCGRSDLKCYTLNNIYGNQVGDLYANLFPCNSFTINSKHYFSKKYNLK